MLILKGFVISTKWDAAHISKKVTVSLPVDLITAFSIMSLTGFIVKGSGFETFDARFAHQHELELVPM